MSGGLLLLLAHPDDESFMIAGTAARLTDAGRRVALVCATRGQAGSAGQPPRCTRDELPAVRERELRAACAILGIALHAVLDYEDRRLADADDAAMRQTLVAAIRAERPQVVATFDPTGVTGHRDHQAICRFALDAVTAAADPRWYSALGPAHAVRRVVWGTPVPPWEEWRPEALAGCPGVDYVVDVRGWADRKRAALRAHATQHQSVERYWFGERAESTEGGVFAYETFRHGWGVRPEPLDAGRPADDLFAGLEPAGSAGDGSARDGSAGDGSARDGSARDGSARQAAGRHG